MDLEYVSREDRQRAAKAIVERRGYQYVCSQRPLNGLWMYATCYDECRHEVDVMVTAEQVRDELWIMQHAEVRS